MSVFDSSLYIFSTSRNSIKMPLYELFCIAVHNPVSSVRADIFSLPPRTFHADIHLPIIFSPLQVNLRGIVNIVSTQVHQTGGVVRDLRNLGINMTLPQRIRRMRQYYSTGEWVFLSHFPSCHRFAQMGGWISRIKMEYHGGREKNWSRLKIADGEII